MDTSDPWTIHIKDTTDATRFRTAATQESVAYFNANKTILSTNSGRLAIVTSATNNTLHKQTDTNGGIVIDINHTGDGNQIPSTFFNLSEVAYIRVCMTFTHDAAIPDTATLANVSITADKILTDGGDELTNLFDPNDPDVFLRGRINSSGNAVAYADGQLVTGFIQASVGDVFKIETDKSLKTNGYTG